MSHSMATVCWRMELTRKRSSLPSARQAYPDSFSRSSQPPMRRRSSGSDFRLATGMVAACRSSASLQFWESLIPESDKLPFPLIACLISNPAIQELSLLSNVARGLVS